MASSQDVLQNLTDIADQSLPFAAAWHFVAALGLLMWALGFRLPQRFDGVLRCVPLGSVSVLAWMFGNVFDGVVFALLTLAMAVLSWQSRASSSALVGNLELWTGAPLTAIAWLYPQFIDSTAPSYVFAYASPLGTLPSPTLSLLIGLQLLTGRPWGGWARRVLAMAGMFYGILGVLRLGIWLDATLLLGSVELLISTLPRRQSIPDAARGRGPLAAEHA